MSYTMVHRFLFCVLQTARWKNVSVYGQNHSDRTAIGPSGVTPTTGM